MSRKNFLKIAPFLPEDEQVALAYLIRDIEKERETLHGEIPDFAAWLSKRPPDQIAVAKNYGDMIGGEMTS